MRENKFQTKLIKEIESRLPGCLVLKNDANYIQGIPDLSVFYKKRWAFLECKKSEDEAHQANQDDYIDYAQENSFGAFIYPENKEAVLDELQRALGS